MSQDQRLLQCRNWLQQQLKHDRWQLTPLANDASFRRYFRLQDQDRSYIVMDAPPERENCKPFIAIAKAMKQLGLCVPEIYVEDLSQGFLLISDLGNDLYQDALSSATVGSLYQRAFTALSALQNCEEFPNYKLPNFDAAFMQLEFDRTETWYFERHLALPLTDQIRQLLTDTYTQLVQSAEQQPQVCIHRDYHSRNLMVLPENQVGILDFQDAMWGPVTYDLVSLIRDCYIDWPSANVAAWALHYKTSIVKLNVIDKKIDDQTFLQWLDLMGMQRHIKCLGIFTRLAYSYGRPQYLSYLPRVQNYILEIAARYPSLADFHQFFQGVCK